MRKTPASNGNGNENGNGNGPANRPASASKKKQPAKRETLKTWSFDSVGPRKYALQLAKARNGNPCLRIVEGVPQDEGGYRRFEIVIWSEDFDALFANLDEVREYIREHHVATPEGHDCNAPPKRDRGGRKRGG